ncbi:MAG: glycosyltransferase family 39 protein [Chloroflexi bacterium]|nr:glycosyltransferase family 39 protein [Chloroflexota bacterium]
MKQDLAGRTARLSADQVGAEAPRALGSSTAPRARATRAKRPRFWVAGAALLALGALVRAAIVASPLGELDGDEAVVGLMARHIAYLGDRPVFYYNQPYLGSLEAFTAAPLFLLFGSSTPLLKVVPALYSLGFLVTGVLIARRLFGTGPALATGLYLAFPPSMWAVWSTKARGGYAEVLFLGQALLLCALWLAERPRRAAGAFAFGLLTGLTIWTHLLGVVYVLPAVAYVMARRRGAWARSEVPAAVLGGIIGALPLLLANLVGGFPTVAALTKPADIPTDPVAQLVRLLRVGVPVLLGLGQPTTSAAMFDLDWLNRPAGFWPVAALAVLFLALAVATWAPSLARLVRVRAGVWRDRDGAALLVLVALAVPPVVAFSRFGFFVSEARYALPLYSTLPLLFGGLWKLPRWVRFAGVLGLLGLNGYSLATTDVRLWRPEETVESTEATRAELVSALVAEDRHQIYTDYWIAYPVMFETRETVLGYVISGGFNRYVPHADNVQRTPNPAWVFMPGSAAEADFLARLRSVGGTAESRDVSVYRVYTNAEPLAALRPR